MTNFGAIAILRALPERSPARHVRILIAVETFRDRGDGWRPIGQVLLAETAGVSISTLKRGRAELITASFIKYESGRGRGQVSIYQLLVPIEKGSTADPFKSTLTTPVGVAGSSEKRVQPAPEKGPTTTLKGSNGVSDKSANTAGHPADSRRSRDAPALSAKAEALKASGFSSSDGGAPLARDEVARSAPPLFTQPFPICRECYRPFPRDSWRLLQGLSPEMLCCVDCQPPMEETDDELDEAPL